LQYSKAALFADDTAIYCSATWKSIALGAYLILVYKTNIKPSKKC
jgi:hypothetical protein